MLTERICDKISDQVADKLNSIKAEGEAKIYAEAIQKERENKEAFKKRTMDMIRYLESVFSKNGGEPTYIQIFGLDLDMEKALYPQYTFMMINRSLYWTKRGL